jgi:hypothetical protein
MTKPTLDIFSGAKGLGLIYKEQNNINVKFWEANVPLTSTSGRISLNVLGKNRIIILQGAHDGTGFDGVTQNQKIADFVYEMEQWVNNSGEQISSLFTDSLENSYDVDAVDWQWVRTREDPNRIIYSLIMKEK